MKRRGRSVTFEDVEVLHTTDRALLCHIGSAEMWVPRSQVRQGTEVDRAGDYGRLVVNEWWVEVSGVAQGQPEEIAPPLPSAARTYRRLIFEFHPDRNPSGGDAARALNERTLASGL